MTENNLNESNASAVPCVGLAEVLLFFTTTLLHSQEIRNFLPESPSLRPSLPVRTPRPVNAPCVARLLSYSPGPIDSAQLQTVTGRRTG